MQPLANKTVIVTGAGRGIGRATACYLAAQGANVVVNDIDASQVDEVVNRIRAADGSALGAAGSVTDWEFCHSLIDTAREAYGQLDALINNAGLHYVCEPHDEQPDVIKQLVDVNIVGAMYCGIAALKQFRQQRSGSLINLCSGAHLGVTQQAIYSASKGAMASLTYSWALDVKPYGVRVNAVAPLARTRMLDALPQFRGADASGGAHVAEADALAPLFGFLVADVSAAISGQILRFNGRDLSLIRHPSVGATSVAMADWTIASVAQAFDQSLRDQLNPVGLGATAYAWYNTSL